MRLNDDRANVRSVPSSRTWRLDPETPRMMESGPLVPAMLSTPLEIEADMNCRPSSGSKSGAAAAAAARVRRCSFAGVGSVGVEEKREVLSDEGAARADVHEVRSGRIASLLCSVRAVSGKRH